MCIFICLNKVLTASIHLNSVEAAALALAKFSKSGTALPRFSDPMSTPRNTCKSVKQFTIAIYKTTTN